jgi:hypothetical protein
VGIELLEGLHRHAKEVVRSPAWATYSAASSFQVPELSFLHGDIVTSLGVDGKAFLHDYSDAALIFANSTMFDARMMESIAAATSKAPAGTIFVTFSRPLPERGEEILNRGCNTSSFVSVWELVDELFLDMSWGGTTVFFYQRINDGDREESEEGDDGEESDDEGEKTG